MDGDTDGDTGGDTDGDTDGDTGGDTDGDTDGQVSRSSSIYWNGPFPGVKSPVKACALGGVCSLNTVNIKTKFILKL